MKVISYPQSPLNDATWEKISADRVISGEPMARHAVLYTSSSQEMCSGIYECTRGKWRISYTEDEFCTLIEGEIILESDDENAQKFVAPSSFMIPAGYRGTWEALTDARKFFVIYEKTEK